MKRLLTGYSLFVFAALSVHAQKMASPNTTIDFAPLPLPSMTQQLTWFAGGDLWYGENSAEVANLTNLGIGWARSTFGFGSPSTDTFAWRTVQNGGPSSWDWTGADKEIDFLQSLHVNVVVQLQQGNQDPPWTISLSTNDYVAAKAAFINALAARYGSKIWGIEVENEPQPGSSGPQWKPGGYLAYDRHLAILAASQPARAYTRLVGWACQGTFDGWLKYLLARGLTNLCDAISWHCYVQGGVGQGQPVESPLQSHGSPDIYTGTMGEFMQWLHSQVGAMPILVDEVGLAPEVPMRMAKVLVILRASNATMCQLHVWSGGAPPGNLAAFDSVTGRPFRHAVIAAWTAYWLGNDTLVSQTIDSNVFVYAFGNRTFAWCLEGTVRGCEAAGWDSVTDIYGHKTTPTVLTDAVTVFHGAGTLTLTNSSSWRILQMQ
ncbi:MAG TPA: hypothetical protein VLZ30_02315 [Verrucomicrobiae bacterium]|nr:hypothetical protein [Verrucomicrobiae bacterium]